MCSIFCLCSTTAKSTLIAAYSTQMEPNRVNIYKFVASNRYPILEALLGHLDNWFVGPFVQILYGSYASACCFRFIFVIDPWLIPRIWLACNVSEKPQLSQCPWHPPPLAPASACRLSELTVLTLSARTSACEYIFAYISARGKCNHWKSVDSQRGVCLLKRNPQFMQSARDANWFTEDAFVAQN